MSMNGIHRVDSSKLFMTLGHSECAASNIVWAGVPTHYECCFTTMFDTIPLSEFTIAAQVSSAEDSRARTVKRRAFRRVGRRGREDLMTRRNILDWMMNDVMIGPTGEVHRAS